MSLIGQMAAWQFRNPNPLTLDTGLKASTPISIARIRGHAQQCRGS
jgi:hypothetical protein